MSTVISVENLSKKYLIGHQQPERYTALRDVLTDGAKRAIGKLLRPHAGSEEMDKEEFWALKDVSFEIKQGDRVGIIGRNGAGKSTLLKILSRITEPTSGRVAITGRVASLLEVGTGFHPELTGRENIYLNGAILGMGKAEIKSKFDEIVAFAEIEKFLDTPVKRYSSGMYVRLAFAVAAHLEPEILVVDEVLAVGDAAFQKKCAGKMEDVGNEGRTILFVSHNIALIQQLCHSGILLRNGEVCDSGSISKVAQSYLDCSGTAGDEIAGRISRSNSDYGVIAGIADAWPVNGEGSRCSRFALNDPLAFNIEIRANEQIDSMSIIVGIDNSAEQRITTVLSEEMGNLFSAGRNDVIEVNLKLPRLRLKPGMYSLTLGIRRHKVTLDHVVKAMRFEVSEISSCETSRHEMHILGDVLVDAAWRIDTQSTGAGVFACLGDKSCNHG